MLFAPTNDFLKIWLNEETMVIKNILITGGTGSFGRAMVEKILSDSPEIERLVVFSRDELKQYEMSLDFPPERYPQLRFFLGDVRDASRLKRAIEGVDTVIHAAALKQVLAAEYNPFEFVRTNILGSQNLIDACLDSGVNRVVALSTDKAAAPVNLYGASKLAADKLFLAANNIVGSRDLRFSVVRYGNVLGSRGSVFPLFLKQREYGYVTVTDPSMTRFSLTLTDGVNFVWESLKNLKGGEVAVPKLPSYRLRDVVEAIAPGCDMRIKEPEKAKNCMKL